MKAIGTGTDQTAGTAYTRKAADSGYAAAELNLGSFYYFGEGVPKDYVQALLWLNKAAAQHNAMAEHFIGLIYASGGDGVTASTTQASSWYSKAVADGDATAAQDIAKLNAAEVEAAEAKAREARALEAKARVETEARQQAAQQASVLAAQNSHPPAVPHDYSNPYSVSDKKLIKLADNGDADAAFELGNRYRDGPPHVGGIFTSYALSQSASDLPKAYSYYHKAADLNYADASQERNLGYWYQNHSNNSEYVFWLARAGNHGSIQALIELGDAYYFGKNAPRDEAQANLWWGKALDLGRDDNNAGVAYRLGRLYLALRRNTNQAIAELKMSAAQGNTDAMQLLGEMNRDGLGGIQKNAAFAQQWFDQRKATLQQVAQAQAAQARADAQEVLAAQQAADAEQANEVPEPQAQPSVFGAIVNALGAATANADPNGIQDSTNQQLGDIQAARDRQIAAQQAQQTQAQQSSSETASGDSGPVISPQRSVRRILKSHVRQSKV